MSRSDPRGSRKLRPYLCKSVAVGLDPACDLLEKVAQNESDADLAAVARWLREWRWWYFESGER